MKANTLLKLLFLSICISAASGCGKDGPEPPAPEQKDSKCIAPAFLKEGDLVAIISPSYSISKSELSSCISTLESWGLKTVLSPHALDTYPNTKSLFAGTEEDRAADLKWALENDEVKAIVTAKGGYGAMQFLDRIPLSEYSAHPKWIMGFSDVTNLLCASAVAGVMCIHGPTAQRFATSTAVTLDRVKDIFFGNLPEYKSPYNINNIEGKAEGMLVGGNLYTLRSLFGTDYDICNLKNTILFIEETDESISRVDEMFNSLMKQHKLDNIKGIICGYFINSQADIPFNSSQQVIAGYARQLGIPIAFELNAGHGNTNLPLIIGAPVSLEVTEDNGAILKYTDFPTQKETPVKPAGPATPSNFVKPAPLKEGDKVAVIGASYWQEEVVVQRFCETLESWGLKPVKGANLNEKYPTKSDFYCGTAQQRASDLRAALEDKEIKAIFSVGPGSGANQLIDMIPAEVYRNNPKWIVGQKDFTAILSTATMSGLMCIYGPDGLKIGSKPDAVSAKTLKEVLFGSALHYEIPYSQYNTPGNAKGTLVGGNMLSLRSIVGTDSDVSKMDNIILYLEQTGETYSVLNNMFNTLRLQNAFKNVKGIIFGYIGGNYANLNYNTEEYMLWKEYTSKMGIPVCFGFDGGNSFKNNPLIMGATVNLYVDDDNDTSLDFIL